jgi:hypothetical protein
MIYALGYSKQALFALQKNQHRRRRVRSPSCYHSIVIDFFLKTCSYIRVVPSMVSSTKDDPVPTLTHITSPVQGSCPVLAPEDHPGTYHDQLPDYQASSPALHDYPQRDPVMYQAPRVNHAASSGPADHGYPPPVQLMYQLPGNQASAPVLGYPAPPVLDHNIAMYQGYQAASYQQIPLQQQAVVVTGPQYCLPHETTFGISKKVISFSGGDWTITDAASGRKVFKVDGRLFSVSATKHLRDTAGHQILRMQKKVRGGLAYIHDVIVDLQNLLLE